MQTWLAATHCFVYKGLSQLNIKKTTYVEMCKRFEKRFFQGRQVNGMADKQVKRHSNLMNPQGNTNETHNQLPWLIHQNGYHSLEIEQ